MSVIFPPAILGPDGYSCSNLMGAWHYVVLPAGKPSNAHKIPRFTGGGGAGFFFDPKGPKNLKKTISLQNFNLA